MFSDVATKFAKTTGSASGGNGNASPLRIPAGVAREIAAGATHPRNDVLKEKDEILKQVQNDKGDDSSLARNCSGNGRNLR